MIRCRTARAYMLRAVDDELALERDLELRAHLTDCEVCRVHWERAAALEQALARLPDPPLDSLDVERAVAAVRARCADEPAPGALGPRRERSPSRRAAVAAALALGLIGAAFFLARGRGPVAELPAQAVAPPAAGGPEPAVVALAPRGSEGPVDERAPRPSEVPALAAPGPVTEPEIGPASLERIEAARLRARRALTSVREAAANGGVAEIERGLEALAGEGWPVVRLVERFVDDPDPALALAAVEYLGAKGDRLSARALARRLVSVVEVGAAESLRPTLVRALSTAGEDGVAALGAAAREPELADDVLAVCAAVGGKLGARRAREVVESCEAAGREGGARRGLETLARLGEPGLEALVSLGTEGRLSGEPVLGALATARGGREWLAERIAGGPPPREVGFLLVAAGRSGVDAALPWIAARGREREHAAAASAALAELGSFEALARLFALHDAGHFVNGEAEAALERLEARRPGALASYVEWQRDAPASEQLLECLLEVDAPWVGSGLAALARNPRLAEGARVWASLALGEVGAVDQLPVLGELVRRLGAGEERLAAACLLSIRALGGREALLELLVPDARREWLALLEGRHRQRRLAAPLYKLARRIEPWLEPGTPVPWRTSP